MAHWVTVWRAAQLLGVARRTLQQRVRAGELELVDGRVSTEQLIGLYPHARLPQQAPLPRPEVLTERLLQQSQDLADAQRHLQRYHALVIALRNDLRELATEPGPQQARIAALQRQLGQGLARALATEPVDRLDVMDDMLKVMSAQVTLRPSGRQFVVDGHLTLLQAALRAGVNLNYGCGNGSCGMCKVRVTAGQVVRTQPSDYPLSDAERAQGYVLACTHTAGSSELTLETLEAAGPQDIPAQRLAASVRAIQPLDAHTLRLHLQTPRSQRLRFLAGQSVDLEFPDAPAAHGRFCIASCPCDDRNLHFYIARNAADPFAERLFAALPPPPAGAPPTERRDLSRLDGAVTVQGPHGDFILGDGPQPLVFAACDTGFAPVHSLVEHALSLDAGRPIALFWLATRVDGHFMANQCRAWSEAVDAFEVTLSTDADVVRGATQMAAAMRVDLFDIDCAFYLAGPAAFVDTLGSALVAAGVPPAQIRAERVG